MNLGMIIRVSKLYKDAFIPTRNHPSDAGMDFYALGDYILKPQSFKIIRTGITVEIPPKYFGLLKPKSSNDWLVGAGVVDSSYQGEILFKLFNTLNVTKTILNGNPVGQMVIIPVISPRIIEVDDDSIHQIPTERRFMGGISSQLSLEDDDYNYTLDDFLYDANREKGRI